MACCKAEIEGLYDCLILSYLGVAHQVYCLLTTGNIELGSLITLMLLVQLHKIKTAWVQLLEIEVSDVTSTTASSAGLNSLFFHY